MLELAGRGDIPVATGREDPLILNAEAHWQYKEVKDARRFAKYYGHLPTPIEPSLQPSPLKAHELIIEQVKKHPGEVIIVKEGSFTNLALALLVEPEIAPLVKEVVHMGGGFIPEGVDLTKRTFSSPDNPADVWRYVLKFNTGFDPESSAIIFRSGIPVTFVSGNVTSRVFQYREDLERVRDLGTPYHQLLYDAGLGWLDWSIAERKLVGAHMHDPLTLAVVIDRSFCTFQDMHMDVDKFMAGERPWLYKSDKEPQGSVAVDVDKERFEKWLADRLASPLLDS